MSRFLVTGGAGFIGSHLVDSLIADGHVVRVLDNLSTGRLENLSPLAQLIETDIMNREMLHQSLDDVDGCFHLAAVSSIERCHQDWLQSHLTNLSGTIALFEEICRLQAERKRSLPVVYASSAAVYGNVNETPIVEETAGHPENAYGIDKLGCEAHAAIGSRIHQLQAVGLRFFNVYGPRQDPCSPYSGVITIFQQRMLSGSPLNIHGDGNQVRDFVYVKDAVLALRCAMSVASTTAQSFNVCTGVGTTIRDLAETMCQLYGRKVPLRFIPEPPGNLRISIGDARRAREVLGFVAQTTLQQGLMSTIASADPSNHRPQGS